ncbi:MAG TPA: hypothetical protein PK695_09055 [Chitinophagaceae bacterium]|jgi:hypothetical protein|nr:hypothetical protein [Chitinophagaceae bacterium]HNF46930.1 hypothetical protein [Chitinophagaceae bacterium]HNK62261.1 hypothetical protein [Chitinophagaceae bacterium]HNL60294.1 hypothetical protein [Chitinophagaceae bacterium]HNO55584.1 hypothetical protein [Chitinophagaceae bacterium]
MDYIFSITKEWVQEEAKQIIKRNLTDEELYSVKKGIESALLFDIDTIFKTAIKEAVSNNSNKENDFE